ncbi:MAG TPA: hypothetical protein VNB06_05520 [Thermoanaerobaculia bacterium]|nr:hypothetical protein [Thermoanaerobaculia bacterium]
MTLQDAPGSTISPEGDPSVGPEADLKRDQPRAASLGVLADVEAMLLAAAAAARCGNRETARHRTMAAIGLLNGMDRHRAGSAARTIADPEED